VGSVKLAGLSLLKFTRFSCDNYSMTVQECGLLVQQRFLNFTHAHLQRGGSNLSAVLRLGLDTSRPMFLMTAGTGMTASIE